MKCAWRISATGSVGGTDADLDHEDSRGLSYSGKMAMGIFAFALILWVSNGIPNYVTSLIVIFCCRQQGLTEKATLGVFGI